MPHVHHVCWCLEPDDMDGAKQLWEERLGTELVDFVPPGLGIRVLINWAAGVEIIAPHGDGGTVGPGVRAFLDGRGEGVYAVVVEVDDLEEATAQAQGAGASVIGTDDIVFGEGDAALRVRQVMLDDLLGMRLTLQKATPAAG